MKKKQFQLFALSLCAVTALSACTTANTKTTESTTTSTSEVSQVDRLNSLDLPQLDTDIKADEDVVELVTSEGKIKIKLFPKIAPKAVENFMTHAKNDYYNDTVFHRVIEDFMIQGGDPAGNGTGGESIWGEGFEVETSEQLYHIRGALSMARAQALDSQGSQFFIVQNHQDVSSGLAIQHFPEKIIEAYKNGGTPNLDKNYTVFGQVIEGIDVVDKIAAAKKKQDGIEGSSPESPVKIEKINIIQEAK